MTTKTTTDDVIFCTSQPTITERIKGWFERKLYMCRFYVAKHERIARYQKKHAYTRIYAERRVL